VDLQACRAAAVASMELSTMLVPTATGGVLQSMIRQTPGTESCTTTVAISTGPSPISRTGFLFVASEISPIAIGLDSFDNLIIYTPKAEQILK